MGCASSCDKAQSESSATPREEGDSGSDDGVLYVPNYDNIGNIPHYLDANGNIVAQYTYDVFGGTMAASGSLAAFDSLSLVAQH